MSKPINDGGPAFPNLGYNKEMSYNGMTLRDWFAGQALSSFANTTETDRLPECWDWMELAKIAYVAADAMLVAREGRAE